MRSNRISCQVQWSVYPEDVYFYPIELHLNSSPARCLNSGYLLLGVQSHLLERFCGRDYASKQSNRVCLVSYLNQIRDCTAVDIDAFALKRMLLAMAYQAPMYLAFLLQDSMRINCKLRLSETSSCCRA